MSDPSEFIIEDGVLRRYIGPGGEVVLPAGVTTVGESAFERCGDLLSVTIPGSVKHIEKWAFAHCRRLRRAEVSQGVESIGDYAFFASRDLQVLSLPDSAGRIPEHILSAREEGRTVLNVSHNMASIRALCDRCVVLDHGKILFEGDTNQAVQRYLDHALGADPVRMDLTQAPHAARGDEHVRLERLALEGKEAALYESGEALRLAVDLRAAETMERVLFRLTLRNEANQAVGTAWSAPMTLRAGAQTLRISLPLDLLVQGRFYASVGLCAQGERRALRQLDHVTRAFAFEVVPGDASEQWPCEVYGPVRFPELQGVLE